MINRRRAIVAASVSLSAALAIAGGSIAAQQPDPAPQPNRGVQVGVPEGRGAGGAANAPQGRGRQAGPPPGPPPRRADGRVFLGGATPAQKGVWLPGGGLAGLDYKAETLPFQPWARALFLDREKNQLEPHTRCKPSGVTRQFLTPYGVEFVELTDESMYIFDIGGPHTYREVFMDGRTHPNSPMPSYYGHSIGWWEGDTLVVDTTGYNEGFWMDRRGLPTTDKLHTLEKFTRTNDIVMRYEVTVDDPGAYTKAWTSSFNLRWENGTELFEYVCQQMNYAMSLMVGTAKSVDRTSAIVP